MTISIKGDLVAIYSSGISFHVWEAEHEKMAWQGVEGIRIWIAQEELGMAQGNSSFCHTWDCVNL